jgi:hypothetical protein
MMIASTRPQFVVRFTRVLSVKDVAAMQDRSTQACIWWRMAGPDDLDGFHTDSLPAVSHAAWVCVVPWLFRGR